MSNEVQELQQQSKLQPGVEVTAKVVAIEDKKVNVIMEGDVQGVIPIRELAVLRIQHPSEVVQVDDDVRATVIKYDDDAGVYILSKREVDAAGAWSRLHELHENKETFEVNIYDVVKGGLVCDVGVRGFIPASMVDKQFISDLSSFKGQTIQVQVAEIDEPNNKLILSRKAALDTDQRNSQSQAIGDLHEGEILTGTVQRITNFGVFVNIGGVDGLVHISELAWHHVENPEDLVKSGDEVQVKILKIDSNAGRISLSIKAAQSSPWEEAAGQFQPDEVTTGIVRRLADFGAFVELAPGIEGLVHVSQISNEHVAHPSDVLHEGDEVQVRILAVEPERKRISLTMKEPSSPRSERPERTQRSDRSDYTERPKRERDRPMQQQYRDTEPAGTGATIGDLFADLFKKH